MMKAPTMPLPTLIAVEPCLCAWYQCVPGDWPICGEPGGGGHVCALYSGNAKQYG